MTAVYSQVPKKKKSFAYHSWARSEAKIPVDGWIASGILRHDMAIYQRRYAVYNEILLQGGIQADQKMRILVHSWKRATDSTIGISANNAAKHRL
jgi:hypothetical protein